MAEVLLGQCYYLRFDPKLWEAMRPYPPLGTLYAASHLRNLGFSVALFDAMLAESTAGWETALDENQPRYAVLYEDSFNYLTKMCLLRMREAAFEMVLAAKRRGATVIVSSSDATDHTKAYLARGADYILIGEGEITLGEILSSLAGRIPTPVEQINGVVAAGLRTPPRPLLRDLDSLPFPAWGLVDVARYRQMWQQRHQLYSINMATTRGCPYQCNWCAKPIYGQRYHSRSPENVVEELALLKRTVQPDHIWFCDDIFGLKRGWIQRFSELVRARNLQTPFKCLLRTDLVTETTARQLRRAGCQTVWVGAESGSQKVLDAMDKGASVEDTYKATRCLRQAGIEVGYFLQFGYPGENWEDIVKTFQMVRDCMPDDIGVSVSYPLPGTRFYHRVKAELGRQQNWLDSEDLAMLYKGPFVPGFYRRLHGTLHKEFRARQAWRNLRHGDPGGWPDLVRFLTLPSDRLRLGWLRRKRNGKPTASPTPSS
ncbi:MAG: B12-binding domain-containing radical SAM protein [Acidobacteriota bacterium]